MDRAILDALIADRAAKRPVAMVTKLDTGAQALVHRDGAVPGLPAALVAAARHALQDNDSQTVEMEGARWFIDVFNPPLRLVIVGAVHIAQPLSRIAAVAGYEVIVIDPRASFATDARFPGVTLVDEWPDDGLKSVAPDRRTAVVTLTHDPKLDDPALMIALKSEAFYIGSLGSRRTHATRVAAPDRGRAYRSRDRAHPCAGGARHRRRLARRDRRRDPRPDHRGPPPKGGGRGGRGVTSATRWHDR